MTLDFRERRTTTSKMYSSLRKAGSIPTKLFTYSTRISYCRRQILPLSSAVCKVSNCCTSDAVPQDRLHCGKINSYSRKLGTAQRLFHCGRPLYDEVRIVETPPFAESVSEGDVRWDKAVGDFVKEDETVGEIETDKTAIPVPAPASGVILEFLAEDGDTVVAGQQLFKLKLSDVPTQDAPAAATPAEKPAETAPPPPPPVSTAGPIPTQPPPIPPTPTAPMSSKPVSEVKPIAAQSTPTTGLAQSTGVPTEHRVTKKSQPVEKENVPPKKKILSIVIDGTDIVYHDYVDISVAVATPKGLVVPVIRDVNKMNFADIERTINELGVKARSGTLAIEDMDGGTFTISNGGVFGSMFGTPIINPPQSAILGMHAVVDRPVAIDGKVEIRPIMYVALTYDHRLIDGREAVIFLRKIKSAVEDPHIHLLDL
ncbi:dihydrolipoyllysine-residue succinyltransferase component of 2-oxoglutarate dehydrogenase complex, mitochondrial-like [Anneissia japonica]|uniref:dihydrolipoyllysine-residue succinyltransferase component of 2-oxoglutarate dehydrogenase complex, mitochondrial-like n=1 Tax=Anneissia japonica TaxID=1529436 RepID=UPI00142563DD|nr:dihydrolipoyllysine-residue succinyltransferase component of 2-oxoglutarate dehydrogenase complex, mitochondrial-like [Anneissia japonica]